MTEPFCVLCPCKGEPVSWTHPVSGETVTHKEKNWPCPLLGGNICDACCTAELMAGFGASDTLREVCQKSRKTAAEVHAACVACPHGGPECDEPMKLIAVRAADGNMVESGPEFEEAQRLSDAEQAERLAELKRVSPKDWWPGRA